MDYVRNDETQGRSSVFFKAQCPCILPYLIYSLEIKKNAFETYDDLVAIFYQNYNCDNYFSDLLNFGKNLSFLNNMTNICNYLYSFLGNN